MLKNIYKIPYMMRPNYSRELSHESLMPIALSAIEAGVIATLARKIFLVNDLQFAILMSAPIVANLTSLLWVKLTCGRSKIYALNLLHIGIISLIASIAFLPRTTIGSWLLVLAVCGVSVLLTGRKTLFSAIRRSNYPRNIRATLVGQFGKRSSLILGIVPILIIIPLDYAPELFRASYIIVTLFGLIGVLVFWRVRIRKHKQMLVDEKSQALQHQVEYGRTKNESRMCFNLWAGMHSFLKPYFSILVNNKSFRWYMTWQMMAGTANMAGWTAATLMIIDSTEGIKGEFIITLLFIQVLPLLISVISMRYFANMLNKMHIVDYRKRHGNYWLICQLLYIPLAYCLSGNPDYDNLNVLTALILMIVILAQSSRGLIMGGAYLAWQLGHNDFSKRKEDQAYMGIHVFLTGIRGLIGPFLGVLLFSGISNLSIPMPFRQEQLLLNINGLGWFTFVITSFVVFIALAGFYRLSSTLQSDNTFKI